MCRRREIHVHNLPLQDHSLFLWGVFWYERFFLASVRARTLLQGYRIISLYLFAIFNQSEQCVYF